MSSIPAWFQNVTCRVLVPALLLWFGGASFLNCCAGGAMAAPVSRQDTQSHLSADGEADHCAVVSDHCHKVKAQAPSATNLCAAHKQFVGLMPCCSPAGQAADRARRSRITQERADFQVINDESSVARETVRAVQTVFPARVRDGSETYLRDCLFLI